MSTEKFVCSVCGSRNKISVKPELQEAAITEHSVSFKGNSTMQLKEDIPLHVYMKTIQSYYWVKLTVCVIAQHCFLLCKLSSFSLE